MFLQYDKHNISFVRQGLDANIQPALCLHTLTQTGGPFTPPYPRPCFTSRVNIIYGVYSRFFSTLTLKWKSSFSVSSLSLSLSRSHSLSHTSFPAIPLTHTRTDGCNSFHFFTFFQSVRNKLLQPRLYFHKVLLIIKCEGGGETLTLRQAALILETFSCGWRWGWDGGLLRLHTRDLHVSRMHTFWLHILQVGSLVSLDYSACEAFPSDSREMTEIGRWIHSAARLTCYHVFLSVCFSLLSV